MARYEWNDFTKEEFYPHLEEFFTKLMPLKNKKTAQKEAIVFVSRKAYGLFLLWKKRNKLDDSGYQVYSDRFVMKNFDESLFENQRVKLVDDTISTGEHLKEVCKILKERTHANAIIPTIFIMSTDIKKKELEQEIGYSIENKLTYNANKVLRFSAIEMLILHKENIPYMVELPNIQEEDERYYISVSKEEYERMRQGNDMWSCFSYEQLGYEQNEVNTDVYIRKNHILQQQESNYIFEFNVRVQVTKAGDQIRLVVIPFAVLKSIPYHKLLELFYLIFGETEYGKDMREYQSRMGEDFPEKSYVALYRAVVFNLSMYVGREFLSYLYEVLGGERLFGFGTENYKYNFEYRFIKSNLEIQKGNYTEFLMKLIGFEQTPKIGSIDNISLRLISDYQDIDFDYRTVSLYFLAVIEELKDMQHRDKKCEFLSIENYQELLEQTFPQEKKEEQNDLLGVCISNMLGQSRISNELRFDRKEQVIYRGFRYGENSEAYFDLAAKIFYAAVKEYYDMLCEECENKLDKVYAEYRKRYGKFLVQLKTFLLEYDLYGSVVTRSEFKIYSKIFKMKRLEKLNSNMEKRNFLLDDQGRPYYIEVVQNYIRKTDI